MAKVAVAATELSQIQRNIADNTVEYQKIVRNCHEINAVYKSMIGKRDAAEKQMAELEQATRTIKNAEADSIRAETVRAQTELTKLETTRDNMKREIILLTEQRDALKVAAPIRAFSGSRIVSPVQSVTAVIQQTPASPPAVVVSPNSSTFDLPQNFFNAAEPKVGSDESRNPFTNIPGSSIVEAKSDDKIFTNFVDLVRPASYYAAETEQLAANAKLVAAAIDSGLIQPPIILDSHHSVSSAPNNYMDQFKEQLEAHRANHPFAPNPASEPTEEQKAAASKIFGTQ